MWFTNRNKYNGSAKEVNFGSVSLRPETDLTLDHILVTKETPEKTHRKYFGNREKMVNEMAVTAHNNLWGMMLDRENHKPVYFNAADQDEKGWYVEMPYFGDKDDYEVAKFADADTTYNKILENIKTLARLKAANPRHLLNKRDYKKHSGFKRGNNAKKFMDALEDQGIKYEKGKIFEAVNTLEPLLGMDFDNDAWLGNYFDGRKIDEDKSGWVNGFYDLPHLIESTFLPNKGQVQELKKEFLKEYNSYVDKKNKIVAATYADTKGTMLSLIDTFLPNTNLTQKIKKKIERKSPKTFAQYKKMLNKKKLKGNTYMIDCFIDNLVNEHKMSEQEFEVRYQSSKLSRSMASFSYYNKMSKTAEKGSLDEIYFKIGKQDQLEKAIEAADYIVNADLSKYKTAPKIKEKITGLKATLESTYKQLYKQSTAKAQAPVARLQAPQLAYQLAA